MTTKWIVLEAELAAHGSTASAAEAADQLRAAGVLVTRNSRVQWVAPGHDSRVQAWMRSLASSGRRGLTENEDESAARQRAVRERAARDLDRLLGDAGLLTAEAQARREAERAESVARYGY